MGISENTMIGTMKSATNHVLDNCQPYDDVLPLCAMKGVVGLSLNGNVISSEFNIPALVSNSGHILRSYALLLALDRYITSTSSSP